MKFNISEQSHAKMFLWGIYGQGRPISCKLMPFMRKLPLTHSAKSGTFLQLKTIEFSYFLTKNIRCGTH